MTLPRIMVAVLVVWFLLGVVALVVFSTGGEVPGRGQGDRIELPG
jgi:hypothetical protein